MELLNPLFETEKQEEKISLGGDNIINPRSEEGIKERVAEAKFADPEMDEAQLDFSFRNNDNTVETQFATKAAARRAEAQKNLVDALSLNPTPDAIQTIQDINTPVDTRNAVNKAYGAQVANSTEMESEVLRDISDQDQESVDVAMDAVEEFSTKASIVRDVVQKAVHRFQNKDLLDKAVSVGATLVPFASWVARNDAVDNAPTVSWLPGNNTKEQIEYIWSLPIEEVGPALQEAVDDIALFSDFEAMIFAQAFLEYSSSEEFMDDMFGVLDVASVVPFVGAAKVAKGVSKSVIKNGPNLPKVFNTVGDTEKAATQIVGKHLSAGVTDAGKLELTLPTLMNVDEIINSSKNLSSGAIRKLKEQATVRATAGTRLLENGIDINSLNEFERIILAEKEFQNIKKVHTNIKDSVMDSDIIRAENTVDNVDRIEVQFGKLDGSAFKSEKAAKSWAGRYLQFKDFEVVEHGEGFSIKVQKPIKLGDRLEDVKLTSDATTA